MLLLLVCRPRLIQPLPLRDVAPRNYVYGGVDFSLLVFGFPLTSIRSGTHLATPSVEAAASGEPSHPNKKAIE